MRVMNVYCRKKWIFIFFFNLLDFLKDTKKKFNKKSTLCPFFWKIQKKKFLSYLILIIFL
ncbi:hypothetical protein CMESO_223 (nucleomorph) [Chroomonas mesostigmatica CCMP1168]|uniref:Uncharacterized protein n=1 Tax=Chroomonas mesostigmatica CCMP1168 TaxID=1195612 RepID=J7G5N8_9CRYP|nr:hypothetical protein CMESO_223 [Chroomonas mesostigmatica CCMP1168]